MEDGVSEEVVVAGVSSSEVEELVGVLTVVSEVVELISSLVVELVSWLVVELVGELVVSSALNCQTLS